MRVDSFVTMMIMRCIRRTVVLWQQVLIPES